MREKMRVVEKRDGKTYFEYNEEMGLVIRQWVYDIDEEGMIYSKYFVGMVNLDEEEIAALRDFLEECLRGDGSEGK
ncbi:hypothetical protein [Thermococcus sp.]|uniref:hypothetical protein n=1 Tax=Thermococcus sp. TaxID=35749 RepID=UPI00260AEFAA|nr:hypothetical protein [Thermococcus sp.]